MTSCERRRRSPPHTSVPAEANVHVRFPHDGPVATGATRQDRTCTFVSDEARADLLSRAARFLRVAITVRTITAAEHVMFNATQPWVSFLQTPAWAKVKSEWESESVGWFDQAGLLVGAGLILYRQLPKIKKYLAYLPEGPMINWEADDIGGWLVPLAEHAKEAGAFGVRIGTPVVARRWDAETIKNAIADPRVERLSEALPDLINHRATQAPQQHAYPRLAAAERGGRLRRGTATVRLPAADRRQGRGPAAGRDEPALAAQHQEGGKGRGHRTAGHDRRSRGLPPAVRRDRGA